MTGRRTGIVRAAVFTSVAAAVVTAGYLVFIRRTSGQYFDERALRYAAVAPHEAGLLQVVPAIGIVAGLAAFCIALARRLGPVGIAAAFLPAAAPALADLLKWALPRPYLTDTIASLHNSYPSGHTAATAGAVLALVVVVPPGARLVTATFGSVLVAAIGTQLVTAGWHRPADILGGSVLAVLLAGLLVLVGRMSGRGARAVGPGPRVTAPAHDPAPAGGPLRGRPVLLAAGVVAGAILLVALAPMSLARPASDLVRAYVVCIVTATCAAAPTFAVLLLLPHRAAGPPPPPPPRAEPGMLALDPAECQTVVGTRPR